MSDFENNLVKGDRVFDTVSKRPGTVSMTPQAAKRNVRVLLQGDKVAKRLDVMKLRLIVDGVPEDVAPISGTPPAAPSTAGDPIEVLKLEKAANKSRMDEMTEEFTKLRTRNEKIDQVIQLLST